MAGNKKWYMAAGNIFFQIFFHIVALFATIWLSGLVTSFWTGEFALCFDLNFNAVRVLMEWMSWLFQNFFVLSMKDHDFIKLKLLGSWIGFYSLSGVIYAVYGKKFREHDFAKEKEAVYGDAHWSSEAEIKKAGLRCKEGMLLGTNKKGYFINEGFQHTLLFAPTGAGKGVGFVIPNLLFWTHSVVVHDIKLENYDLTSGWRASIGQKVFKWEPSNPDGLSHCYNPMDWISKKSGQMVDDVQKMASLLLPKQDFWENEARGLFLAVALYILVDPSRPKSFGEVTRVIRGDDLAYGLAVALDTMGEAIHPVAYMNITSFIQKADGERSGVSSTLSSCLELWANPLIDSATSKSDFNVLEFKKHPHTIYVGLTPDNIARLQKLMQVFYQQSTEFLSRKMPNLKEEPFGVMYLLDEFPTLGKMEQFKSGIAYFRGYRVRLFLIIQDTQQLKGIYEEAGMNSFLSNSTFRVTYAANNYETANLISQLCGNKTVENESFGRHQGLLPIDLSAQASSNRNVNVSQVQRALLLPQEVMSLPRDEQIVLIEAFSPIRSSKIFYYKDPFFTSRLIAPVFVPTQKPYDPRESQSGG